MLRRVLLALVLVALPLAACSRRQPPEPVTTTPVVRPDTAGEGARRAAELERLRQDSIARARAGENVNTGAEATARALAILQERVHFDYDESNLRTDAQEALGRKVPILRSNPNVRIMIEGHADERGSLEYNLALGMRRANAVRDYLAGFGIAASVFETNSMGEDRPLNTGGNESAWAQNRRAEFIVLSGGQNLIMPGM